MSSTNRANWIKSYIRYDIVKDKNALIDSYISYMLDRTQRIFKYSGLPDTIPQKDLELILQVSGNATITQVNGKLYAFRGGLGGEPNPYYLPTISVVANPSLNYSKTLEINKECIIILNDSLYSGLIPMFNKYASLLAESDISLRLASINSRVNKLIKSDSDPGYKSAQEYIKKLEEGELAIISSDGGKFFSGVTTEDYSQPTGAIKEIIELRNYIESSWFMDLGLNSNYNMKRESLSENEIGADNDILLPLIEDMLECRKQGIEKVNKMYGTNISVELASVWKQTEAETMRELEKKEEPKEGLNNEDSGND